MIFFKTSVRIVKFTPAIRKILFELDNLNALRIPNYPIDWWVTSINDSRHVEGSRHYTDEAVDLRSHNFDSDERKHEFVDRLSFALGVKFTVLLENVGKANEHFHIQVKKGMKFP